MATLRKGRCYSKITGAYTRRSKVKSKSYVKAIPQNKIVRYDMGNLKGSFNHTINLISTDNIQIRHNALESARLVIFRRLQKLGNNNFYFKLKAYPHQILRENKMLSGARADRLQTGMSHAFGKPVGLAAQLKSGNVILKVDVNKENIKAATEAIKLAIPRLPGKCTVEIKKNSSD
ncbi:50S ribosomal protein L16 [Candidatus Woesearchaeota archaeon]|nr:50S ribosomal protein L16 [Candidatus Woesearchaeota archaeon]